MIVPRRLAMGLGCVVMLLLAVPAGAQIADQLSAYTGVNAEGYLQPLADAVGADLNSALFRSAHIPTYGLQISFEVPIMGVIFGDDDRTFMATTESGFSPETRVEAPTVVGSGDAVIVDGDAGTSFAFPGGLDLNSFALAVPQLRIGSYRGTEALIRYIAFDVGDAELGDVSLFGFGLRHSISQYLSPEFPAAIAAGFFWQRFDLGQNQAGGDLISASAFTFGVQASKRYGDKLMFVEPYTGLSVDTFSMDVSYESDTPESPEIIDLSLESDTTLHLTLGVGLKLAFVNGYAEYSVAGQNSFSFGLGFGN